MSVIEVKQSAFVGGRQVRRMHTNQPVSDIRKVRLSTEESRRIYRSESVPACENKSSDARQDIK